ncbi:MAG TPA: nitrous oxide reductase accessory protein NosL [Parvularculaceae bacterium]|nr:nitrous oxide reductase accessory protein NosL [Parvularculaceae bacterium]
MKRFWRTLAASIALSSLAACNDRQASAPPPPVALTDEAVGYYCGMLLSEHDGPKAQIIVEGRDEPFWFSQVRDGVHFLRSPEETAPVRAFYVTDFASVARDRPMSDLRWIAASDAFFVIDSATKGGMGAPEAVPFSTAESAALYIGDHGGRMVRLNEIPDEYVEAPYMPAPDQSKSDAHDDGH